MRCAFPNEGEEEEEGGKTSLLGMKESADAINATLAAPASCINSAAALCPTLNSNAL
jgi:hypothetical protein